MYPEKCSTSFYMVQGEKKNEIRGQAGSIRLPAHINNHADSSFSFFTYIHGTSTSVVVCQTARPAYYLLYVVVADVFMMPVLFIAGHG